MVVSSDGLVLNDAYSNIKNRNLDGDPCGGNTQYHYYIRIPHVGSINAGWIPPHTKTTCVKNLTFTDIKWIYNTGDWNSDYDVSNNKMIVNEINSIFKKYEKI